MLQFLDGFKGKDRHEQSRNNSKSFEKKKKQLNTGLLL